MTNGYTSIGAWQSMPNSRVNIGVWQDKWAPPALASVSVSMIAFFTFLINEVLSLVVGVSQTLKLLGTSNGTAKLNTVPSSSALLDGTITELPGE